MMKFGYSVFQRVTTKRVLCNICLWAIVAFLASSAISVATAAERKQENQGEPYTIGLWGDLPYSDVQALTGVPNLIADMNSQNLAFTVHDGDLKAGSGTTGAVTPTTCSEDLYKQSLGFFNALNAPAAFTPGDNDWTDCDRPRKRWILLTRAARSRASAILQHQVYARTASASPDSADSAAVPRRQRCRTLCRKPSLGDR